MDLGLTHRRAIVTGGSKGLGLATVTSSSKDRKSVV